MQHSGWKATAICLLILVLALPRLVAADEANQDLADEVAAYARAGQFVDRLDQGDYSGAWMALDSHSRQLEQPLLWQQRQAAIRAAYGAVLQRQPRPAYHRRSYAQHPDGHYIVVSFATRFASKALGIETIIVRQEPDGMLAVIAYHSN